MSVSVRNTTQGTNTSTTTVNKPSGTVQNDVIYIIAFSDAATTAPGPPSGFTTEDSVNISGVQYCAIFRKVAGASEPASYTFTAGSGSSFNGCCAITLTSNDTTTPTEAINHATVNTANSITNAALTAAAAGDVLVIAVIDNNNINVSSWPSGVTQQFGPNNVNDGMGIGTKSLSSSGSTGSLTTNFASSDSITSFAFLVQPPVSGSTKSTGTVPVGSDSGGLNGSAGAKRQIAANAIGSNSGGLLTSTVGAIRISGNTPIGADVGGLLVSVLNLVKINPLIGSSLGGLQALQAGAIRQLTSSIGSDSGGLIGALGAIRQLTPSIGSDVGGLIATAQKNSSGIIGVTPIGSSSGGLIVTAGILHTVSAAIGGFNGGLTAVANNGTISRPYWLVGPKTGTEDTMGDIF